MWQLRQYLVLLGCFISLPTKRPSMVRLSAELRPHCRRTNSILNLNSIWILRDCIRWIGKYWLHIISAQAHCISRWSRQKVPGRSVGKVKQYQLLTLGWCLYLAHICWQVVLFQFTKGVCDIDPKPPSSFTNISSSRPLSRYLARGFLGFCLLLRLEDKTTAWCSGNAPSNRGKNSLLRHTQHLCCLLQHGDGPHR